jgi:heat shock protein HslJ
LSAPARGLEIGFVASFQRAGTREQSVQALKLVPLVRISVALALAGIPIVPATAQSGFPFDRDLVLDARAMRGSKRLPVLSIEASGRAQIDLWCKRGQGQATIAADTITIAVGAMNDEPCSPERAQADEEMIAALSQATNWSQRGDVVTLTGAKPLRFRAATN